LSEYFLDAALGCRKRFIYLKEDTSMEIDAPSPIRRPADRLIKEPVEFVVRYAEIVLLAVAFGAAAERLKSGPLRVLTSILMTALFFHTFLGTLKAASYIKTTFFPHRGGSKVLWAFAAGGSIIVLGVTVFLLISVAAALQSLISINH
jgi:hypothetical protein